MYSLFRIFFLEIIMVISLIKRELNSKMFRIKLIYNDWNSCYFNKLDDMQSFLFTEIILIFFSPLIGFNIRKQWRTK